MRTNVVIDDDLMKSAFEASGLAAKMGAIEERLKLLVQLKGQKRLKDFRCKLRWSGNLEELRSDK